MWIKINVITGLTNFCSHFILRPLSLKYATRNGSRFKKEGTYFLSKIWYCNNIWCIAWMASVVQSRIHIFCFSVITFILWHFGRSLSLLRWRLWPFCRIRSQWATKTMSVYNLRINILIGRGTSVTWLPNEWEAGGWMLGQRQKK